MPTDDEKRHGGRAPSHADRATPPRGRPALPATPTVPASIANQIAGPQVWTEELTQPGEPVEVTIARRAARQEPGEPLEAANARRLERASIATTLTLQRMDAQDKQLAELKTGHVELKAGHKELGDGLHRVELAQVATTTELTTLVKLATAADKAREQERTEKAAAKAAHDAVAEIEAKAAVERKAAAEAREDARADKAADHKFELSKMSLGRQVALVAAVLTGVAGIIAAIVQFFRGSHP